MKRVLVITYYWSPSGGAGVQRWIKMAKYLRDFGWEPVIYTVSNGDYPLIDETMGRDLPSDLEVIRTPIWEPYQLYHKLTGATKGKKIDANFLSEGKKLNWKQQLGVWVRGNFFIPDARCFWIRPSIKYLEDYLKLHPVDAIVSTGPPHTCHRIALGVHRDTGAPWIVDYRDPWTQIDFYKELHLTPIADRIHKRMEQEILDSCQCITTVGRSMKDDLRLLTRTPVEVVMNGFDEVDKPADVQPLALDEKFTIVYVGTMNNARNPLVLWKAMKELHDAHSPVMSDIHVKLVGGIEQVVFDSARSMGLEGYVEHIPPVTHSAALEMQNKAQVLLLVINQTWNAKTILTGKMFEYLASHRPVLCIGPPDGDAATVVNQSQGGVVIDYGDVANMKATLLKWHELYLASNLTGATGGLEPFTRRAQAGQIGQILDRITYTTH